jgi:hypothetical protein
MSTIDRSQLTHTENNALTSTITSFMLRLSPYILMEEVEPILEYLVKRFQVNTYSSNELILTLLPYHQCHIFAKMIKLIPTDDSVWAFLKVYKSGTSVMPRSLIVQKCIADPALLSHLVSIFMTLAEEAITNKTYTSFYTCVLIEYITLLPDINGTLGLIQIISCEA